MTVSILADIERAYRACNHGWLFVPNHKCSASTCDIEQMDVMSYTLEGYGTPMRSCALYGSPRVVLESQTTPAH